MGYVASIWAIAGIVPIGRVPAPRVRRVLLRCRRVADALLTAVFLGLRTDLGAQILVWAGSSGLSLVLLRRYLQPIFSGLRNRGSADELLGQSAEVIEPIVPGRPGRVRIHGTTWRAISHGDAFAVGDMVDIVRNDSLTLEVTGSVMEEVARLTDPDRRDEEPE